MNYKICVRLSSMLLVGAAFYLTGCGPENLDDPSYVAQMNDWGINDAKDTKEEAMPADADKEMDDKDKRDGGQPGQPGLAGQPGLRGGAPMAGGAPIAGGAPVAAAVVPAVPVVELPPVFVAEPGAYVENVPIETTTGEHHAFNRTIVHERQTLINQPHFNTHVVSESLNEHHVFHETIVNTDSFGAAVVASPPVYTQTSEVLPTTVIEAPPVIAPVPVAVVPVPVPGCAPWLGGGFFRGCGRGGPGLF